MDVNVAAMGPRGMPSNGVSSKDGSNAVVAASHVPAVRSGATCVPGGLATDATLAASSAGVQQFPIAVGLNGAVGRTSLPSVRGVMQPGQSMSSTSSDNNNSIINGNQYHAMQSSTDRRSSTANSDERTLQNGACGGSPGVVGNNANCNASRTPVSGHSDSAVDASPASDDRQLINPSTVSTAHSQYGLQQQQQQQVHHHGQPPQPHQQKQPSSSTATLQRCAACGREIADRFLLHAIDRYWHTECLRCSACQAPLADLGSTCFTRSGMTLCRPDYMRCVRDDLHKHIYKFHITFATSFEFDVDVPSLIV